MKSSVLSQFGYSVAAVTIGPVGTSYALQHINMMADREGVREDTEIHTKANKQKQDSKLAARASLKTSSRKSRECMSFGQYYTTLDSVVFRLS